MQAIILCGGFGSRLGELTRDCPKPLLDIGGQCILEHQIRSLKKVGITSLGINLHHLGSMIRDRIGDGSSYGVSVTYIEEPELSGTAGGVKLFEQFIQSESFLVLYGDIVTNEDLNRLISFHQDSNAEVSFYVHKRQESNSIFHVQAETGKVLAFLERPAPEAKEAFVRKYAIEDFWVNSAIYCMRREVIGRIPVGCPSDIPRDLFPSVLEDGGLYALPISGNRVAIDSEAALHRARALFL